MDCGDPWINPAGNVPSVFGGTANTVSVTVIIWDLTVAPGARIVTVPVYIFGTRPVGFTVAVIASNSPAIEILPVGEIFSQLAPVTLIVAESGDPLLARTNGAVREGSGIGFPTI